MIRWLLTVLLLLAVGGSGPAWAAKGRKHNHRGHTHAGHEPSSQAEGGDAQGGGEPGSVSAAQKAYDNARYEEALRLLGDNCRNTEDPPGCERLRGFIHVALGEAQAARAAFDRMLALDPTATLGPDVSPKLQAQFAEAKKAMIDVQGMRIEKLEGQVGDTVLLEVKNPPSHTVEGLVAHITRDGKEFAAVPLRLEGEVWAGSWHVGPESDDKPVRYYLEAQLAGGAEVQVGEASRSFALDWAPASERSAEKPSGGLPGWAPWVIGGGVAAAVVTAIVVGVVVASQPPAPGAVQVNVVLHD